jgi:peroxiredoxin Q/BCP
MWKTMADCLPAFFGRARGLRFLLCWFCAAAPPLMAQDPLPLAGEDAPPFSGHDQDGNLWKLSDHIGKRVLFLYFYPKDDSPGCTTEACSLRDNMYELKQAGVEVVGVSFDDKDTHKNFIFKYNLDFTLLADTSGAIADAYGVRMGGHKTTFSADDIKDLSELIKRWKAKSDPASILLWKSLSKSEQTLLSSYEPSAPNSQQVKEIVVQALNKAIDGPRIYKEKRLKGASWRPATLELMKQSPKGRDLALLNRLLLEDTYPLALSKLQTMARSVSFLLGLDGKIIHVTDSPDPTEHVKELAAAMAKLRGSAAP